MNQNQRATASSNMLTNFNRHLRPITLCHSCGSIIRDIIPPNAEGNDDNDAVQRSEESLAERYTCVAIYITGSDGIFLTFCHKCNENFEVENGTRQRNDSIVDECGDHERILACLKCFPLNSCIGDGPENSAPYVVNIRYTEN